MGIHLGEVSHGLDYRTPALDTRVTKAELPSLHPDPYREYIRRK
jgi:hypothetical protein